MCPRGALWFTDAPGRRHIVRFAMRSVGHAEIRDPVHGPIQLSAAELAVVDTPAFQRLRRIKQLGFGELTFPGATHTRYLHSLGAMHMAGLAVDAISARMEGPSPQELARVRAVVRLAALLHDIGHPPLSHQLEYLLPPLETLPLPPWLEASAGGADHASHEHMSLLLLLVSPLGEVVASAYEPLGLSPRDVAAVLHGATTPEHPEIFCLAGRSALPLLRQLVAGELDCDRMDYLRRDAYFAGVSYGSYDHAWVLSNLVAVPVGDHWELGLLAQALHTFEDFLLARYHMFMMVYAHYRTLIYDRILRRFVEETGALGPLPAAPDAYVGVDDRMVAERLAAHSENPWARRLLDRRPMPLVLEIDEDRDGVCARAVEAEIRAAGLTPEVCTVRTPLSKYCLGPRGPGVVAPPLRIVYRRRVLRRGSRPVAEVSALYARFRDTPRVVRFFLPEAQVATFEALDLEERFPG